MDAVKNELSTDGRYLYPRLHENAFLDQVKPLVSALVGSSPGLSYGDALKRAYAALTGDSLQGNQTKLPANNSEQADRAVSAAVSVRGRSTPQVQGQTAEIPPEALKSPRDSVKWALNQLRRG